MVFKECSARFIAEREIRPRISMAPNEQTPSQVQREVDRDFYARAGLSDKVARQSLDASDCTQHRQPPDGMGQRIDPLPP